MKKYLILCVLTCAQLYAHVAGVGSQRGMGPEERGAIESLAVAVDFDHYTDITRGGIKFDNLSTLFHPQNNEEIIGIIDLAKRYGRKVRVIGATHSLNPCCLTYDYMISLDRMTKVLEIGSNDCTVEGGIYITDLCKILEKKGLTLPVLPAIGEMTLSGSMATGTRGQVPSEGSIGSLVTRLEIIDGNGVVHQWTPEENPDEFYASITSLGMLGVITKVTLRCTPLFLMAEIIRFEDMSHVISSLDDMLQYDKLVMYWNVDHEEVKIISGHKLLCEIPQESMASLPMLGDYPDLHSMNALLNLPDRIQRVGKSWQIASLLEWPSEKVARLAGSINETKTGIFQGDYSIPLENFAAVIREMRTYFRENRERLWLAKDRMVIEMRPVKKDKVWFSPSYGRDSICLCFHDFERPIDWSIEDAKDFIEVENILKKYGARPHLGKAHFFNQRDLEAAFPRWSDFKTLRKQADPHEIFFTPYLSQLFSNKERAF